MDGVDAAAVSFTTDGVTVHAALTHRFDPALETELGRLRERPERCDAGWLARLDARLGDAFAEAACALLDRCSIPRNRIRAIGSHGQTVFHDPRPPHGSSLQLGDPARIAHRTGIDVIADFRRADIAAGGQGAPLAPLLHQRLLAHPGEHRLVLNLGGIANLSLLPATGGVQGFDTGPANCLLDAWCRRHRGEPMDRDGRWAASGRVIRPLLEDLLSDPWFGAPPPKSTGIEHFNLRWLEARLGRAGLPPTDVQATLAELTAASVADAITRHVPFQAARLLVAGGGAANTELMRRIRERVAPIPVQNVREMGVDPDHLEAMLFAWLAQEFVAGRAIDTRSVTGARAPVRLGALWPAP